MKKIFLISVIVLLASFCIFTFTEIIINETHIPDVDQLKIKTIEKELELYYRDSSQYSIEKIQEKHKETLLGDVLFFSPSCSYAGDILVLAYWNNIYKDKEFIVMLYKNGAIAIKSIRK